MRLCDAVVIADFFYGYGFGPPTWGTMLNARVSACRDNSGASLINDETAAGHLTTSPGGDQLAQTVLSSSRLRNECRLGMICLEETVNPKALGRPGAGEREKRRGKWNRAQRAGMIQR